ncbi:MAG: methionyl-tRNA formyltransferase [Oxalobacteraceae bacterium]|nr:methionyl-tRNA formyltransferase [Oxalobacteraceae bacterium]
MRAIFAGTPEFAAVALAALHAAGIEIPLVLTQPDRPAGRGMQLQASPVKQFALAHQIPVAQPTSLRLDGRFPEQAKQAHDLLRATAHDVMVVAAYGLILPPSILAIPPLGCINIHASLLPRWRGAAPIHRAIEAGDAETGITIMQMDAGLDTGDMMLVSREPISPQDTTGELHDRLAALGGRLIVDALLRLAEGRLTRTPQPDEGVSYAAKISKDEAALDLRLPATTLLRRIHAFNPAPGASVQSGDSVLKIWRAERIAGIGEPGLVLAVDARGVTVACGEDALLLTELQKPGGKRLPAANFLQGFSIEAGQRLQPAS